MDDYDYLFKCLAVGDGGGGKTALIVRFSQGFFQENYKLTIGVDFAVKNLKVKDYTVKLQIWDTGGQERFQYVRPLYYKGAMGCIVLFDVTNRESFNHIPRWLDEVMKESGTIPMLLVGNKIDLESERQVSRDEAEKLAKDLNMLYTESSAKSGTGVLDVFEVLSLLMIGEKVPDDLLQPKKGKISLSTTEPLRGRKSSKKFKPAPISPPKPPIASIKPSPLAFSNDRSSPKSKLKPKPLSSPFINQKSDMLKQKSPLPLNERSSLSEMNINPKASPNSNNEPDWFAPKVKPKQKSKPAPMSFHKQVKQPFPISIQKTKPNPKEESFSDQIFNHPQKSSPSSKSSPNEINEKYDGIQKQKSTTKNPFLSKTKRHSVPRSGLFNDIEPKIIQPVPISNSRKNSKGLAQILTNLNESIQPSKPDAIPFSG
ncbi:MAG: GTP-binding protein, partial [Promethearchaeota archaeon]